MSLDDAREWWRSEEEPAASPGTDDEVLRRVKERSRDFDRAIRARDRRETIAAALVVLLFAPLLLDDCLLARLGAALVIAGGAITVFRLERALRAHPAAPADRPLVEVLRAERDRIDAQVRLLGSVLWWYVLPFAVGATLVVACLGGASWFTVVYIAFVIALSWGIWHLNQQAVRRDLRPHRDELDGLIRQADEPRP